MRLSKRRFLRGLGAAGLASAGLDTGRAFAAVDSGEPYDIIIVGAGTAGLPTAIFASQRGARILLIEAAPAIGGTLFLSSAQMAAAGTKLQQSKGIVDSPQMHFDDVMRIGGGTADPEMLRLFVDNAAAAVDWLSDHGFQPMSAHPVTGGGHEAYTTARYFWAKDGGLAVLAVLDRLFQEELARGTIALLLDTEVKALVQESPEAPITGVVAAGADGKAVTYLGLQTVLTSGGYGSNSELFARYEGIERYGDTFYPYSQGAGITLAVEAGGSVRGQECRQPLFNGIMADNKVPSILLNRVTSDPEKRQPWEIYVNRWGQRFFQEDTPSFDAKEKALKRQPAEQCWVVFDEAIVDAAPPIMRGWSVEQMKAAYRQYPTFYRDDTLEGLAAAAGIDQAGLLSSVADYNRGQKDGKDRFGRQSLPLPIGATPFYAIKLQGYYYVDSAGLRVDTALRVLGRNGKPIPNLYAAGEILGYGQLQGAGYSGGMAVTPALTFGRLLGQSILQVRA